MGEGGAIKISWKLCLKGPYNIQQLYGNISLIVA